jgi:antitoxin HicB
MNGGIGSSFDDFLKEDGIYDAVTERAKERVRARQREASPLRDAISPHPDVPRDNV